MKAGLQRWGERAREALKNELNLFIQEEVFENIENINEEQKRNALRMHCFIVEKRDEKQEQWQMVELKTGILKRKHIHLKFD